MPELVKINDYNELLEFLISQYSDSENLKGIIQGVLENANDIETALFEIQDEFYLFNALGAQLDVLGIIFVVERDGRIDPVYRQLIQEKAILHYSGEPEAIIEAMKTVYGALWVKYRHGVDDSSYYIYTDITGVLSSALNPISPSGVQGFFEKPIVDGLGQFLVDASEKLICSVIEIETLFLTDALGVPLVDANNKSIVTTTAL